MIVYVFKGGVKLSPRVGYNILQLYSDEIEFLFPTERKQEAYLTLPP